MTMRMLALGLGCGFSVVVMLFLVMMAPGVGPAAEWLLDPGYALPEAYWGATHDPIQVLTAFFLNVIFYAVVLTLALWCFTRKARGKA
jgi:hypothetical protein